MSEILPRFYVHVDNEKWIIVRMGDSHIVFGSATSSTPVWQPWHGWQDKNVEDGAWVEITYANMRPPTRELDDLRAELKEKTREIERLRAELDSENQTVNTLTRKLKATLDRQDERPVVRISAAEERINTQIAKLNDLYRRIDDRISKVVDNTSAQLHAHKVAIEGNTERIREFNEGLEGLVRETAKQITDLKGIVDQNKIVSEAGKTALQDRMHRIDVAVIEQKKASDGAQRIEASRHEALRQRVEKIERVVPPGSGNLQTIVENLAVRMAADPQNAFQTYVDTRIQRISSWFDTKLSAIGGQIKDLNLVQSTQHDRVVVTERKIDALEGSDNAMFEDLQKQIEDLKSRADRNTQDINARISRLDQKVSAISSDEASLTKGLANATSLLNDLKSRTYHNTLDLDKLSARITSLEAKQ